MLLIHRVKDDNCVESGDRPSSLKRKESETSDVNGNENPGFVHDSYTVVQVVSPHRYAGLLLTILFRSILRLRKNVETRIKRLFLFRKFGRWQPDFW